MAKPKYTAEEIKLEYALTYTSFNERTGDLLAKTQQRLMKLKHSQLCPNDDNCPYDNCKEFKDLWKHFENCKDGIQCKYRYCISSKVIYSHYEYYCNDPNCLCCPPIRENYRLLTRINWLQNNKNEFGDFDLVIAKQLVELRNNKTKCMYI